jgi:hypothetical protein
MNKKTALLGLLVFALYIGSAYSDPGGNGTVPSCPGPDFIDDDGDGLCDNYQTGACQGGDCGRERGAGYVDEDGDSICDYSKGCASGCRRGYGRGTRWA